MKKEIYCIFLKRLSERQDFQFYPGKLGLFIYENISKEAWDMWKDYQTILINEKRLTMLNLSHRKFLEKEMIKFFSLQKNKN